MFPILNMYNATFVTYNCKNVKRSTEGIRQICGYADIIALQETWLFPHDLPYLSSLHEEFGSTGTSAEWRFCGERQCLSVCPWYRVRIRA